MEYKYINTKLIDSNGKIFTSPLLIMKSETSSQGNNELQVNTVKNIYDLTQDTVNTIYTEHTSCYTHDNSYYWGGTVGSLDGDYFSYKIPVISGKSYYIQNVRRSQDNEVTALFCTSDGELAISPNVSPINTNLSYITIPNNVAYIRVPVSASTRQNVMVLEGTEVALSNYIPYGDCLIDYSVLIRDNQVSFTNLQQTSKPHRFYGKKVNTIGDSLTAPGLWQKYLKDLMGFSEIRNYGVAGTTVTSARGEGESTFRDRAPLMDDDADLIIVFTSINDNGASIGTWNSEDVSTVGGAGNVLVKLLRDKYPHSDIIFTSNPHTHWEWSFEACDMYKEVCRHHSIPFCDLLGTCGIDGTNKTENAYYYSDGIHLTDVGQYRIAQTIAGFLRGL